MSKSFVLGIDIGGNKIDAQLLAVQGGILADEPVWATKQDTQLGINQHRDQITAIVKEANKNAKALDGTLIAAGIGSPGLFDAKGRIKPGTSPNMGYNAAEFDNAYLKGLYMVKILEADPSLQDLRLYIDNDAKVMLSSMLRSIKKNTCGELEDQNGHEVSRFLHGKYVGLLGIGTGVGHAIARIDGQGEPHFVTDGHASKLRIKVDDKDWHMIDAIKSHSGYYRIMDFPDHTVRAEDLFRSESLHAMVPFSHYTHINAESPHNHEMLRFAGKYMARTIQAIKSGESTNVHPENSWSEADKAEAAKTSVYLIGGGIGSSPLGRKIIEAARDELGKDNEDIQIVQMPGTNLARSAALLVPEQLYRAGPQAGR